MAAKGGVVRDITVGDCLELLEMRRRAAASGSDGEGPYFYQLLHAMGVFPADAPATVRMFAPATRGSSPSSS